MRWEDERYVRVYTRSTIAWRMMPWQARTLLLHLFRAVDRAGLLDVGEFGAEGIAALVDLPLEVVEPGLAKLLEKDTVRWTGEHNDVLFIPNFLQAQEAHSSDAQRKRDQRERAVSKAKLPSQDVEEPDSVSHGVTDGHESGQEVTIGHSKSLRAVPSHAVLNQDSEETLAAQPAASLRLRFDFASVYAAYPRKDGRTKGIARLRSQVRTPEAFEQLQQAVKNFAAKCAAEETELQFVPHFSTWVSRWRDYVEAPQIVPPTTPRASKPPRKFNDGIGAQPMTREE